MHKEIPELAVPYFRQLLVHLEDLLGRKHYGSIALLLSAYSEVTCRCIMACVVIGSDMVAKESHLNIKHVSLADSSLTNYVEEDERPDASARVVLIQHLMDEWHSSHVALKVIIALKHKWDEKDPDEDLLHQWYVARLRSSLRSSLVAER